MANQIARHLRKHQTIAETKLWRELRKLRHHGYHFRRQVPISKYIVDFACLSQKVIIEVDGVQHDDQEARVTDAARDADLVWRSFKVLRFRNSDVRESLEGVMLEVLAALGSIDIQDSHRESVLIHCASDQLIRSVAHGETIRARRPAVGAYRR